MMARFYAKGFARWGSMSKCKEFVYLFFWC